MAITKLHFMQKMSRVDFKYLPLIWSAAVYILSSPAPTSTFLMCKDDARIRDNFKSYSYKPLPAIVGNKEICIEWVGHYSLLGSRGDPLPLIPFNTQILSHPSKYTDNERNTKDKNLMSKEKSATSLDLCVSKDSNATN